MCGLTLSNEQNYPIWALHPNAKGDVDEGLWSYLKNMDINLVVNELSTWFKFPMNNTQLRLIRPKHLDTVLRFLRGDVMQTRYWNLIMYRIRACNLQNWVGFEDCIVYTQA
jgi:hypothetical protein